MLQKNGEWKFLADLGVSNTPPQTDSFVLKKDNPIVEFEPGSPRSLLKTEKKFIKSCQRSIKDTYQKYMSTECFLNRNGRAPAWFQDAYYDVWNSIPQKIQYTINGSGIASTGDLGYVYGTTLINGKTENYLRIWRKGIGRKENEWRIALEVLKY